MTNEPGTIVVVDDDSALREALSQALRAKGFTVLEAGEVSAASDLIRTNKVDLILTDIRMPGRDGVSLLHEIKQVKKMETPILLMTGFSDLTARRAYDMGASGVIHKPFEPKTLFDTITTALSPIDLRWGKEQPEEEETLPMYFEWESYDSALKSSILRFGNGGFFTAVNDLPPEAGTIIQFEIEFPKTPDSSISGFGVVRWVRSENCEEGPRGCGIEFLHLDDDSYSRVLSLIAAASTTAYIPER